MKMSINRDFLLGMAMGAAATMYMVVKKFGDALNAIGDALNTTDEDDDSQE